MAHPLFDLLRKLEDRNIFFNLNRYREDSVTVSVTLVGERLEIDVFEDGHIEYSRFTGSEEVLDDLKTLDQLLVADE